MIWTTAYVSVGTFAAGSFRDLLDRLHYAGYIFAGILAVFVIATLVVKKLLERSEERHMDAAGRRRREHSGLNDDRRGPWRRASARHVGAC